MKVQRLRGRQLRSGRSSGGGHHHQEEKGAPGPVCRALGLPVFLPFL